MCRCNILTCYDYYYYYDDDDVTILSNLPIFLLRGMSCTLDNLHSHAITVLYQEANVKRHHSIIILYFELWHDGIFIVCLWILLLSFSFLRQCQASDGVDIIRVEKNWIFERVSEEFCDGIKFGSLSSC